MKSSGLSLEINDSKSLNSEKDALLKKDSRKIIYKLIKSVLTLIAVFGVGEQLDFDNLKIINNKVWLRVGRGIGGGEAKHTKIYNPLLSLSLMAQRNALEIKEKILSIFKARGPSLPVHIAKETDLSILFASAFLSELIAEKKMKYSIMKIGSSPLYFLPGQENMLENFSEHLKGREKEAFNLIKEKKFLKDSDTEPAIRVALREIKDFAIPFRIDDEVYWRYLTAEESEFIETKFKETGKPKMFHKVQVVEKQQKPVEAKEEMQKELFEEKEEKKQAKPKAKKIPSKRKKSRENEKFLEMVKEFLAKSSIEIISIEGFKKDELILKVKINGDEQLLAAYNKKKISEKDIIKAAKKAAEQNLKYSILSLGELPKKISDLIEALKDIKEIEKIE
ncbi:hypothetical protein HYT25_04385 [Candidatus Pacearchaeota archaeon]|nr:hypothetical protein [Candidatus Pacearchaeota archaeon]